MVRHSSVGIATRYWLDGPGILSRWGEIFCAHPDRPWRPTGLLYAERSPRGVLFFHDNAPVHRALAAQKKLAYLGFQCLDHPPYPPDLAPSDYHLFSGLKIQLKVRHFSSDAEVIFAAETWLDGQPSELFLSGLQKLEQWAKKCIELRGEYVE